MDNDFDVAIIGLSCRFPGADSPEQFWRNLAAGVESIARLTDADLDAAGVSAAERARPGYVRAAPLLNHPDRFDAAFFGFPAGEAATLDPQHRVLLELAQLALDDAGCDPRRAAGRIGVFAGAALNTYFTDRGLHRQLADHYIPTLVANDKDFLATRVSYKLGLRGPSVTVQSACSTALVAVHLARQSLLNEECDLALAGAVSVRVPHGAGYREDGSGVTSPDGHVRAFDAGANGTVFGSGAGVVALKRLADAQAHGDRILAVIKGSAINNDGGLKAGYTAPSVDGQAEVVVEALANAGLTARDLSYVEAHGTGTQVGDRIEVLALTKAFREFTPERGFCALGSVKPNVGHLDAAAGMAGLIKTVLALRHGQIPPTLHFSRPNPEIDFPGSPFVVNAQPKPWPTGGAPRRAGVMATGMGGTNAHLILEEAPPAAAAPPAEPRPELLLVSAKTSAALEQAARALGDCVAEGEPALADAAFTLQTGRAEFRERRFAVADDGAAAAAILRAAPAPGTAGSVPPEGAPGLALLLPGVGDHYLGMGRGLYERFPVFREELDRCADLLRPLLEADIRTILYPPGWKPAARGAGGVDLRRMLGKGPEQPKDPAARALEGTLPGQPALFAVEYALAKLWLTAGARPAYLLGHSLGEYVAACLSGVMSLPDALRAVVARARLVSELPLGAMLALSLPEADVRSLIAPDPDLSVSLINGPALCVVAGPAAAVERLRGELDRRKILFRPVRNAHAFHSRMMEPIAARFLAVMRGIRLAPPALPFASNVTGAWITPQQATDPAYWVEHACRTARFGEALGAWWQLPEMALLETGPGRTLGVLAAQHPARPAQRKPILLASLRPEYESADDAAFLLQTAGRLWTLGVELDWTKLEPRSRARKVALPGYPFERRRHWIELPAEREPARSPLDSWFYTAGWREAPLPSAPAGAPAGTPLVLAAEPGAGADAVRENYRRLLTAVQRRGDGRDAGPLQLAVITHGAFDRSGSELTDPAQAAFAAASLAVAREFKGATTVAIDLEPGAPDLEPARLAAEIAAAAPGAVIALRGRRRWERVLLPTPMSRSLAWRRQGAYLIAGGTGGLGLELARHLARTLGARMVLMSRRPPEGLAAEIARLGGEAAVVAGDVADADAVERAVAELRARYGAVHGVFHLAGVLDDRLLLLKDAAAADRVLLPKIAGADHLCRAVHMDRPDFICFFSSLSSVIPFPGQSDYAAANAYLDALAARLQAASDLRVCAISWPVWRDVGIMARPDAPAALVGRREAMLARGIDFADGMEALGRALASGLAHVVVTPKLPAAVAAEADRALDTAALRAVGVAAAPAAPVAEGPRDEVEQTVAAIWAELLGREQIGTHQNFLELGGHSLLAMRIVSRLRELYAINLTLRTFFEGPTIAEIAAAIQSEVMAEIENLSEEEAAARQQP